MPSTTPVAGIRYATQSDSAVAQTLAQNLAEDVDRKILPVYATTAARDTAIPSPTEGMFCYVSAVGTVGAALMGYSGSAWVNWFRSPLFAYKTATESVTSSTTLQADNHLVLAVRANSTYVVEGFFIIGGNDTGDAKYNFTFPASTTLSGGQINLVENITQGVATSGDVNVRGLQSEVTPSTALLVGIADTNLVTAMYKGVLVVGGTGGNITLQWAQNTSDATATTFYVGSYLKLDRVA